MDDKLLKVRTLLDQHDWDHTLPRLLKFALQKIRQYQPAQTKGQATLAGKTAEDYVMEAILKVYKGERKWDPDQFPNLMFYLFGVLRSDIGHHAISLENRCIKIIGSMEDYRQDAILKDNHPKSSMAEDEMLSGFIKSIKKEQKLVQLVEHIVAGLKPREIAEQLNVARHEIYNMRKVLRRRLEEYLAKLDLGKNDDNLQEERQ